MKFQCTKENISKVVGLLTGLNTKNINLPILKNVFISAEDHGIKLIVTNLEIAIKIMLRGKVETKGEFTVPTKIFSDFLSLIDTEVINFELKNNELNIKSSVWETSIKGSEAADFPVIPTIQKKIGLKINNNELKEALDKVVFAVSHNELRPELGGVLFKINGNNLKVVGTDSFRLAEKSLKIDKNNEKINIIIPYKTAEELRKILSITEDLSDDSEIDMEIDENQVLFRKANIELTSRIIEGEYPNYEQIIPSNFSIIAKVPKDKLLKSIKASSLFSKSGIFDINLTFDKDKIYINSNDSNTGEYKTEVPCELNGNNKKIILNHKFLLEGIQAIKTNNILLQAIDESNPLMLLDDKKQEHPEISKDYFYLIMPIRQ